MARIEFGWGRLSFAWSNDPPVVYIDNSGGDFELVGYSEYDDDYSEEEPEGFGSRGKRKA